MVVVWARWRLRMVVTDRERRGSRRAEVTFTAWREGVGGEMVAFWWSEGWSEWQER